MTRRRKNVVNSEIFDHHHLSRTGDASTLRDGAILTAGQPSLRSPPSAGPRQMTWH